MRGHMQQPQKQEANLSPNILGSAAERPHINNNSELDIDTNVGVLV